MDKDGLLRSIASTGYNVGFGAKKHFATYDIVEKAPGWIGFISSSVGVLALIYDPLSAKLPSAILVILGICTFYINPYKAQQYDAEGRALTQIFNELRDLYRSVQGGADPQASHDRLKEIEEKYYKCGISKQILLSDWYAHYKFFEQQNIDWIEEQLKFTWKDKFPLSLRAFLIVAITTAIIFIVLIYGG